MKKNRLDIILALTAMGSVALSLPVMAAPSEGVKVEPLGSNNALVRIMEEAPLLILPVQESVDDARVNLLVDGNIERTFYVRLAKNKVDYTVPLDLTPYKGHEVVLDVVSNHDRTSSRGIEGDACWKSIQLADTFDTSNREEYRPAFHHTPLYGWMNDPNGMFYKDGRWHLYYQYNPYGSKWQNMTWGHSSSSDLVHWNHEPVAITPDGLGTIFSGSCVVDHDGTAGFGKDAVIALYTSAGTSQMQSLAASTDNGTTFQKYVSNPVLTLPSEARDPNMFFNEATGEWNLILAHALEKEMLLFTSPDLKTWTLSSAFGKGEGAQDGVWECPDLFPLPIEEENKWVLICNLNPGGPFGGSATQYFIGDFDGHTFTADTDASGKIPTKWMDFGKDHYATVSWSDAPDGRRTAIGWMSNWQYAADVPTEQFRSANTLPRDLSLFRGPDGEIYLASSPSPELKALRGDRIVSNRSFTAGKKAASFRLPASSGGLCEILFDIDASKGGNVNIELSNSKGEKAVMVFDPEAATISFDRTQAGISDFSPEFPAVTIAPTFSEDGKTSVHLFIDRSSIELFARDGRYAMTNLVFPAEPYSSLSISSDGKAKISSLDIYTLKP